MNGKVYYENFNRAYSTSQRMDGTNAGTVADNGEKPRYEVAFVFLLTNQSFFNIIRWVNGPNDSATKHLMFQVLFFFHNFFAKILSIYFYFIFL